MRRLPAGKGLRAINKTFTNVNNSRYITFAGETLIDFLPKVSTTPTLAMISGQVFNIAGLGTCYANTSSPFLMCGGNITSGTNSSEMFTIFTPDLVPGEQRPLSHARQQQS